MLDFVPDVPSDRDTRVLCAAVHTNPSLAALLVDELSRPSELRWQPESGFDDDLLLLHATAANTRWAQFADRSMMLLGGVAFFAVLGFVGVFLWSWAFGLSEVAAALVLVWQWRQSYDAFDNARDEARQILRLGVDDVREVPEPGDANVIVHSVLAAHPFVGSGRKVSALTMRPVDVRLGAETGNGSRKIPAPIAVEDIHHYLHGEGRAVLGIDRGDATFVLCVRGDAAADVQELVPDPDAAPSSWVNPKVIAQVSNEPTGVVRAYTRMTRTVGEGRALVTVFVRFVIEQNLLSMEVAACMLPAPATGWTVVPGVTGDLFAPDLTPLDDRSASQAVFLAAWRIAIPMRWKKWLNTDVGEARRERDRRDLDALRAGDRIDRGAAATLREMLAADGAADYFDAADALDALTRLDHGIIQALRCFLTDRGVDTTQLDDREKQIMNSHTYNIGSVGGVGHHIGSGGSTVNHGASAAPAKS